MNRLCRSNDKQGSIADALTLAFPWIIQQDLLNFACGYLCWASHFLTSSDDLILMLRSWMCCTVTVLAVIFWQFLYGWVRLICSTYKERAQFHEAIRTSATHKLFTTSSRPYNWRWNKFTTFEFHEQADWPGSSTTFARELLLVISEFFLDLHIHV